ncbi:hypothetical protein [Klebsiella pneumoniae]|uniref:hypothetical protein n=1 Tax=Klebsiella pneumoniae TaxID=573 RepID=UPI00081397E4|nr:hypothetical protein [Klebsiella pneumoniae]
MNKVELLQKISALATECHALACELDIGDERTEMFEIYSVLHNLGLKWSTKTGHRVRVFPVSVF